MKRTRYCCIQKCENFTGISDEKTHIYSVPIFPELRKKWINEIQTSNGSVYSGIGRVCGLHFKRQDLYGVNSSRLKIGAIPSIFPNASIDEISSDSNCTKSCEACTHATYEIIQLRSLLKNNENSYNQLKILYENTHHVLVNERQTLNTKIKSMEREKNELTEAVSKQSMELAFLRKTLKELRQMYESDKKGLQEEIALCLLNGVKANNRYSPIVREFSLGLHYLSPRAYEFLRNTFKKHLPHVATLRQWYANSDLLDEPGINKTVLNQLKNLVTEKTSKGSNLIISVSSDEINIRKHVQWCNSTKKLLGYATIGNENEKNCVAKQTLVFMVNGVNESLHLPVAHYFISSLNAEGRKDLIINVIQALLNCGVLIANITFDGLPANGKMCKLMGANLNVNSPDLNSSFFVSETTPIHIIYDNCHMLKLIRNSLGNNKVLYNSSGVKIEWKFFERLVELTRLHNFKGMHKVTKAHLQWKRKAMKVIIATQTLSESTACAMEFFLKAGYEEFKDAAATIEFIRIFNKLFDILNSKSIGNNNICKDAVNPNNADAIFACFSQAESYILGLKMKNKNDKLIKVVNSKVRTGFAGFIINMRSLRNIYDQFVTQKQLKSIPTYSLCQDPLEIFFGKIRSLNGYNDNPTIQQYSAAHRKLLVNANIQSSKFTNVDSSKVEVNNINNLRTVSSRKLKNANVTTLLDVTVSEVDLNVLQAGLSTISISHLASVIEQKIKSSSLYCKQCAKVFVENEKNDVSYLEATCQSTFEICEIVDKFVNLENLLKTPNFNYIYEKIFDTIEVDQLYTRTDFTHDCSHKLYLIRFIVDAFINIKGTMIAKEASLNEHSKFFRSQFRKLVHFHGQ